MPTKKSDMTKSRAIALVGRSAGNKRATASWYSSLDDESQQYIWEVLEAMKEQPIATLNAIAIELKKELRIPVGYAAIAKTLSGMIRGAKDDK